eukprot:TRINITY_DN8229_c0_g2_i1.p1 TRINITY_DN8229_c0_g2~~TRINITY_DN8229_c0_g2_i1.p1  ORF type:complete len:523 (+),score=88.50 TRINITY_DN8229_c0_g2_i1:1-1569(+)
MWDGLNKALDVLRNANTENRNSAIVLLTDGQPNISPEGGIVAATKRYLQANPQLKNTSINTFGFGYHLDTEKLHGTALEGNGMYSFIPDSSFVGTIFVNALANILSTHGTGASIYLKASEGVKIEGLVGPNVCAGKGKSMTVYLAPLQFDQTKDIVVNFTAEQSAKKPYLTAQLKYTNTKPNQSVSVDGVEASDEKSVTRLGIQRVRLQTTSTISEALTSASSNLAASQQKIDQLIKDVSESDVADEEDVAALLKDLEGQVAEAFSKSEYYTKWGRHYLPSLNRAHLLQVCNNFKDPGVQVYGGELFSDLRDEADDTFCKLPPPKPSRATASSSRLSSMSVYNSSSAPCFAGRCTVQMTGGVTKRVDEVSKGDLVSGPNQHGSHEVQCVVKTNCLGNKANLVEFESGLAVTPWHPIKVAGNWEFPCEMISKMDGVKMSKDIDCEAVYSFVLKSGHTMTINGTTAVTFGHGFEEDKVKHPYYGTDRVLSDLKRMPGWAEGLVQLQPGCAQRDPATGLVNSLQY